MHIPDDLFEHLHQRATAVIEARKAHLPSDAYDKVYEDHVCAFGPSTCLDVLNALDTACRDIRKLKVALTVIDDLARGQEKGAMCSATQKALHEILAVIEGVAEEKRKRWPCANCGGALTLRDFMVRGFCDTCYREDGERVAEKIATDVHTVKQPVKGEREPDDAPSATPSLDDGYDDAFGYGGQDIPPI